MDLRALVAQAKTSQLFTAPILEEDTARFLGQYGAPVQDLARRDRAAGIRNVYFVGSGGSFASMWSGAYLMRRYSAIPAHAMLSYDVVWEEPKALGEDSIVFLASYSGGTEDTLAALQFAKNRRARTVALVRSPDSAIGRDADVTVSYESTDLYGLPLAAVYLYALEHAHQEGWAAAGSVIDALYGLPPILGEAYRQTEGQGEELAREFLSSQMLYCLAAGVLSGLAYKMAMTVFMENLRVHAAFCDASEFRHGPAEMLERQKPDMFFLLGDDEARPMVERSLGVAQANGGHIARIDLQSFPGVHPLLAPFVLLVPLQWFVVYSALLRGITDLDERVFMGRRVLSTGGAMWP
jgi:fructoselysine 6-phosphate deglycase